MKNSMLLVTIVAAIILSAAARADITLPSVLADHMVLQRDMVLPIWGRAKAGQRVDVSIIDGAGKTIAAAQTQAQSDGKFMARLPAMSATKNPLTLKVACAGESLQRSDVLVGEVWLCAGQSNMEWNVGSSTGGETFAQTLPSTVRCFTPAHVVAPHPMEDLPTQWVVSTPRTALEFTAIGSWFAAKIGSTLDVPVGILSINWGGTLAEPWTPADLAVAHPMFMATIADQQSAGALYEHEQTKGPSHPLAAASAFGSMWNAMMAPVVPYAIRGALWYQGESNADRADQYRELLPLMIRSWRAKWNQGDFPFGIVQLAGFRAASDNPVEGEWSALRDAQLNAARMVPACGLAVTIDVGDAGDIHPRNKKAVADRLGAWALSQVYGRGGEWSGPLFQKSAVQGSTMVITFDHAAGLVGVDGAPVGGFAIAGVDGKFHWADAKIEGSTVIVSSPQVTSPTVVRYAWSSNPTRANLVNSAGFPASPFATDSPSTKPK